jgi:tryptophan synthase beta chain
MYVAETMMPALLELDEAYREAIRDQAFMKNWRSLLSDYAGRPTPLTFADNLTAHLGGAKIYLKREDLAHTGSHKINNTLGQALLAQRMGKKRVIAETGAGQHGVATATVCALLGLDCLIFMGEKDIKRQAPNVFRMKILGARVQEVSSGSGTLKDAMNEALRYWLAHIRDTYYLVGSTAGPHPYPRLVRDFQSVIGRETKRQIFSVAGRLPDCLVACVGGGSNALGLFSAFLPHPEIALYGVEAAGSGLAGGRHSASITAGRIGVLHGAKTYVLQDDDGQITEAHSLAAGLDYPGVGPEHGYLYSIGRVRYVSVDDREALAAFSLLARTEGIIPALESAHAIAYTEKLAPLLEGDQIIVVNVSGRGDKDVHQVARMTGEEVTAS